MATSTVAAAAPPGPGHVEVWSVDLAGSGAFEPLADSFLSADERARADRYRFPALRTDFVLSRGVLRVLIARACGCAPAEVEFSYGAHGKPAVAGAPGLRFNLSHSGGVAVYALSRDRDLGIDVERRRPMPDLEAIARRFFSACELAEIMGMAPDRRVAGFFECWVRKEAYVKALGLGLAQPLDSFTVSVAPDRPAALLEVRGAPDEAPEWSLATFSPQPEFHAALAVRIPTLAVTMNSHTAADLLGGGPVPQQPVPSAEPSPPERRG